MLRLTHLTPSNLPDAEYFTIADVQAQTFPDANASNNQVASRYVTEIVPPLVDLSASRGRVARQVKLRGRDLRNRIRKRQQPAELGSVFRALLADCDFRQGRLHP